MSAHVCPLCNRAARTCYLMPCLGAEIHLQTARDAATWFRLCGYRALARYRAGTWSVLVLP